MRCIVCLLIDGTELTLNLTGQQNAHELQIEVCLPGGDQWRQLILPGQLQVGLVKNAIWTSFASDLAGMYSYSVCSAC